MDPATAIAGIANRSRGSDGRYPRVSISVDYLGTHYRFRKSCQVDVASGGSLRVVLSAPKGTLRDEFRVGLNGQPLATLSRLEGHGCQLMVIRLMMDAVRTIEDGANGSWWSELERKIDQVVATERPPDERRLEQVITGVRRALAVGGADKGPIRAVTDEIRRAAHNYDVIAVIPPGRVEAGRHFIVSEYRVLATHYGRREWFRSLLGLDPRSLQIRLPEALDTRSLHVHCEAPAGMYVYSVEPCVTIGEDTIDAAYLSDLAVRVKNRMVRPMPEPPWRSSSLGSNYVHVYFREYWSLPELFKANDDREFNIELIVRFREQPPAMMPHFLLASASLTGLVLMTAANLDGFFVEGDRHGLALPVLFSLPPIVAGWVVSRLNANVIKTMSVPSALGVLWLLLNVFWAVGVVVHDVLWESPSIGWWVALAASCALHFCFTVSQYIAKYTRRTRRIRSSVRSAGDEEKKGIGLGNSSR